MNVAYRNFLASAGAMAITHIGLVDDGGNELAGGSPAYARQPVVWTLPVNGLIRPTTDLTFNVPSGATVAGWRGYTASSGGTDYDGAPLPAEDFGSQGQYTLLSSGTGISHDMA